uniref:Uncharacterized protein n=1 Tax=Gossypium raimondii TaxID=29730 RepID=A0A0D2RNY4_GOSRA|nr:hypothetical protein B456_003G168400 [Gossypium raimondii]
MMYTKNGRLAKKKVQWIVEEEKFANENSKALYVIFYGVDLQEFKRIAKCTINKSAWDILKSIHEGSQTIEEFYAKLCDLSNQAFAPGEEYSNTKLVRKMLRYLPKRFSIKVTFITEAKDLKSLAIDELIGSLQTFEINLEDVKRNKIKGERSITFQVGEEMPTSQNSATEEVQEHMS